MISWKPDIQLVTGDHKFVTDFLNWRKAGAWNEVGWDDLELESGNMDTEERAKEKEYRLAREFGVYES